MSDNPDSPSNRGTCDKCARANVQRCQRANGSLWCDACWMAFYGDPDEFSDVVIRTPNALYAKQYDGVTLPESCLTDRDHEQ